MSKAAILALEDGTILQGKSIGCEGCAVGEVVFNTSMTGYQEILSDPSYAQQLITLTYPHIGNVGTNPDDQESKSVWASGLIIRDLSLLACNWRSEISLAEYLQQHRVVAISDIDTRHLTRLLRDKGAMSGCIMAGDVQEQRALAEAKQFAGLEGLDLAKEVTTPKPYHWNQASWSIDGGIRQKSRSQLPYNVVVYDFGVKHNILRLLVDRGCSLQVVPAKTPAKDVLALNPDGIFLSNGPGDPAACGYAIDAIKELLQTDIPLFGICLGHQLLALASGASTVKMKFGHHGGNHPVQDLDSDEVLITSQNHGFAVDETSLPSDLLATHRSLFDGSLQGIAHRDKNAFGFQGHPEASPGPHDIRGLFQQFVDMMATSLAENSQNLEDKHHA